MLKYTLEEATDLVFSEAFPPPAQAVTARTAGALWGRSLGAAEGAQQEHKAAEAQIITHDVAVDVSELGQNAEAELIRQLTGGGIGTTGGSTGTAGSTGCLDSEFSAGASQDPKPRVHGLEH